MIQMYDRDQDGAPDYRELSMTNPRAQRDYVCCCCGKAIKKGTKHYKLVCLYDGEFTSERMHALGGLCLERLIREHQ